MYGSSNYYQSIRDSLDRHKAIDKSMDLSPELTGRGGDPQWSPFGVLFFDSPSVSSFGQSVEQRTTN